MFGQFFEHQGILIIEKSNLEKCLKISILPIVIKIKNNHHIQLNTNILLFLAFLIPLDVVFS